MKKSVVRYEEEASDPTAVWRIVSARQEVMKASYKTDGLLCKMGGLQKQLTGLQESMNRVEILVQRLVNHQARAVEPRNIPDRAQLGKLEMTGRVEEMGQTNIISKRGVQLKSTTEGNFKIPSIGFSVVATGWGEDQLPHAFVASPTLNNLNPNSEPESARQCSQLNLTGVVEIPEGNSSGVVWDDNHVNWEDDNMSLDNESDQDVLKVDAPTDLLKTTNVGLSSALRVGQQCLAIGHPFGFDHTLTVGVISGLNRDIFSKAGVTIEDGAHFHMKKGAVPDNLEAQVLPKSHHCYSIRLTLEYFKFSSLDSYEIFTCKFNNPNQQGKYNYGWLAKEGDYNSGDPVGRFMSENGDHEEKDGGGVVFSGRSNGPDEGISDLAHLVSLRFVTLRVQVFSAFCNGDSVMDPWFKVRMEVIERASDACESLLEVVRHPGRKSLMNMMTWVCPVVTTSAAIYGMVFRTNNEPFKSYMESFTTYVTTSWI